MSLRITNTLSGAKETFVPLKDGAVSMYVCGVTVYDHCHVGHARALLGVDALMEQKKLYALVIKKGLSVRELENLVQSKTKGGSRRLKSQATRDHEAVALEEDLQRTLGTKVRLVTQKKRGKIVIEYYSLDDLDRIIKLIKK